MASEYVPVVLAREVKARARNRCEPCQTPADYAPEPFEMEHITPRAIGGATDAHNLALACGGCNGYKGARTTGTDAEIGKVVALFHPRRDLWSEHLAWSDDFLSIIGLTAFGRTTIQVLQMNRVSLRNLRWLLTTHNLHPPDANQNVYQSR